MLEPPCHRPADALRLIGDVSKYAAEHLYACSFLYLRRTSTSAPTRTRASTTFAAMNALTQVGILPWLCMALD